MTVLAGIGLVLGAVVAVVILIAAVFLAIGALTPGDDE